MNYDSARNPEQNRQAVREIITHPDTVLINISTKNDKNVSFERIWGNQSRDF